MARQANAYELRSVLWEPTATDGPKRARRPVRIDAYIPSPLAERQPRLSTATAQAVYDAQDSIADAQRFADAVGINTIAHQLMRSEAIASSRIEGIDSPSHRALAKLAVTGGERPSAQAGLANIEAVRWIYEWATGREPFSTNVILETHRRLGAADSYLAAHAGELRDRQSWIGHDPYTPAGAEFIPPPPDCVAPLLKDLCDYLNRTDEPPLVQAAQAHAQFETIHPFADGNGRVGRTLIGAVLIRRELARDVVPPISLALSRRAAAYVGALTAWRYEPDGAETWIALLAHAADDAASASRRLAGQVRDLQASWSERADNPRADSAASAILSALPAHPILGVGRAVEIAGVSDVAARGALNRLEAAGVLERVTVGRRNRVWETTGLFALVDDMERQLSAGERGPSPTRSRSEN